MPIGNMAYVLYLTTMNKKGRRREHNSVHGNRGGAAVNTIPFTAKVRKVLYFTAVNRRGASREQNYVHGNGGGAAVNRILFTATGAGQP